MKVESCPYCGAVAVCRTNEKYKRSRVVCLNVEYCDADGPWRKTNAEAINAWNRLALAVQIAEASKMCMSMQIGTWDMRASRDELRRLLDEWGNDS